MPSIVTSGYTSGTAFDGNVYYIDSAGNQVQVTKATGVKGLNIRPAFSQYRNRTYIAGQFSSPQVFTEDFSIFAAGVDAPTVVPVLASGSIPGGFTGVTGNFIGYITFAHKGNSGAIIQESNPSQGSLTLSISAAAGRVWTNLPTVSQNPRVTHIRGYVSADGAIPRLAWERSIGVSTVTEAMPVASLSTPLPTKLDATGTAVPDLNARGVPPYCLFVEGYHDSTWWAGDPKFPDRIYPSKLFEPESVDSTDTGPWLRTKDGEAVTGLRRWNDQLIVGTRSGIYAIQGYGPSDYEIRKLSSYYNVISHHSMVRCGPNEDLYFAAQQGVCMYNGNFVYLMENMYPYWRDDYRAHIVNYENCFGAEDRLFRCYILQIPQDDLTTFRYVGHYEPVAAGAQPWWTFDKRARQENALGQLLNTGNFYELYSGACDGYVRKENVSTNNDDDGDSQGKAVDVSTKHYFMGDQSGDDMHGRTFTNVETFLETEEANTTLNAYCGDDDARSGVPQTTQTIRATAVSSPKAKVKQTSNSVTLTQASGKGITLRFRTSRTTHWSLRGYAIDYLPGPQDRPFLT